MRRNKNIKKLELKISGNQEFTKIFTKSLDQNDRVTDSH